MSAERWARMGLCCATEGGDPVVVELVARVGAVEAWARVLSGELGEPSAERAAGVSVELTERMTAAAGARFVVPGDPEWPAGLADLARGGIVQRRGGEPYGLWLRGPGRLAELMQRSVAVVGARASTAYGENIAADLAADLADQGVTVVSGGAFGIDAAAHRGALGVRGPTIGVLACGVDVAYPPANEGLFAALAREHLLVSELPPGAHPTRVRFLASNCQL